MINDWGAIQKLNLIHHLNRLQSVLVDDYACVMCQGMTTVEKERKKRISRKKEMCKREINIKITAFRGNQN